MQPFVSYGPDGSPTGHVVANGEIYNYKAIARDYGIPLTTGSDCEVLLPLWHALDGNAVAWARCLDGVFATVLVDLRRGVVLVARDPYGVRPLYTGLLPASSQGAGAALGTAGARLFASELKGLVPASPHMTGLHAFPPGHVATYDLATGAQLSLERYHAVPWLKNPLYSDPVAARAAVREAFTAAVEKRLLSDRPIGALLSGGLDSSLVAALLQRSMASRGQVLQTFSIGMQGSSDLLHARLVAKHIGSQHHGA